MCRDQRRCIRYRVQSLRCSVFCASSPKRSDKGWSSLRQLVERLQRRFHRPLCCMIPPSNFSARCAAILKIYVCQNARSTRRTVMSSVQFVINMCIQVLEVNRPSSNERVDHQRERGGALLLRTDRTKLWIQPTAVSSI